MDTSGRWQSPSRGDDRYQRRSRSPSYHDSHSYHHHHHGNSPVYIDGYPSVANSNVGGLIPPLIDTRTYINTDNPNNSNQRIGIGASFSNPPPVLDGPHIPPPLMCADPFSMMGPTMLPPGPGVPPMLPPPMPPLQIENQFNFEGGVIFLAECVCHPPNHGEPLFELKGRPPGCKTIFVEGLPGGTTPEMINELFQKCGVIARLRTNNSNFAHVQFSHEYMVDCAVRLSGYTMHIPKFNTESRIRVDYALAYDDQEVYKMKEQERVGTGETSSHPGSLTPPPVPQFSNYEASRISEDIKNEREFLQATTTLSCWLDRGDCNNRTFSKFYNMLQASHGQFCKLQLEKETCDDDIERFKDDMKQRQQNVVSQLNGLDKVYNLACKQRCWDHFSKAQRKTIQQWRKELKIFKEEFQNQILSERNEVDMDVTVSDSDDVMEILPPPHQKDTSSDIASLEVELDSLRAHFNDLQNDIDKLSADTETENTLKNIPLQNIQQLILTLKSDLETERLKTTSLIADKARLQEEVSLRFSDHSVTVAESSSGVVEGPVRPVDSPVRPVEGPVRPVEGPVRPDVYIEEVTSADKTPSPDEITLSTKEATLLGVISAFLVVHPFGATQEYITSYVDSIVSGCTVSDIEKLFHKVPHLFTNTVSGVGASLNSKWTFDGFKTITPES